MKKNKSLKIIKYNKKIQNRLNLNLRNYKEFSDIFTTIEIEIIPKKGIHGKFININENEKSYYHIYLNNNEEETKNMYDIYINDKIRKIRIIIDYQIKSFEFLFYDCKSIESIFFKKIL